MSIAVTEADLHADRNLIIPFLREHLTAGSDDARYDWLYLANPAGSAKVWIARDQASCRPAGLAAAIPRVLSVRGENRVAWVLADFCMAPSYRSLGPALTLQRACLEAAESARVFCSIDFPSDSMMAIYARLGIPAFAELGRYAKLLRLDDRITRTLPIPRVSRPMSAAGNFILRLSELPIPLHADSEVTRHDADFGDEFAALADQAASAYDCFARRSAAYLNWRYLRNPLQRHTVLAYRRHRQLLGYVVFTPGEGARGVIQEIVCLPESRTWLILARATSEYLRKAGCQTAYFWQAGSDLHPLPFGKAGFHLRDSARVIVHPTRSAPDSVRPIPEPARWLLMNGDRDI